MIIKQLGVAEIHRLGELDRSEEVKIIYKYDKGSLATEKVNINVPRWSENQIEKHIETLLPMIEQGGVLFGALDGDRLVGIAVLGHKFIGENLDELQLAFLHVSKAYRRRRIASKLFKMASTAARRRGARRLYISSTPSESAIGFYMSHGCELAIKVDEELYALEPEDIHLVKEL